jgi:hypothetical protein
MLELIYSQKQEFLLLGIWSSVHSSDSSKSLAAMQQDSELSGSLTTLSGTCSTDIMCLFSPGCIHFNLHLPQPTILPSASLEIFNEKCARCSKLLLRLLMSAEYLTEGGLL